MLIVFQLACVERRTCSRIVAPRMFGVDDPRNVNCDPRGADETELREPNLGMTYTAWPLTLRPCSVSDPVKTARQVRLRQSALESVICQLPSASVCVRCAG